MHCYQIPPQPCKVVVILYIPEVRKMKLTGVRSLVPGHTAHQWWHQDSSKSRATTKCLLFSYQNFLIGLYSECTKRLQVSCNSNTGKRIRGKDEGKALIAYSAGCIVPPEVLTFAHRNMETKHSGLVGEVN